ncbi:unnamed protein product [Schistosoma mattheei]|uniref:Uncharacterized protein n=1 Tax=Schistosoma mattheei TaxID=31246 RepID=A0A3P8ILM3_9TREM|nr:unnamed protein product [Schistosoma mattheei]
MSRIGICVFRADCFDIALSHGGVFESRIEHQLRDPGTFT